MCVYEKASGQCINLGKTAMMFSKNTPTHTQEELRALWSNGTLQQYEKYLRLLPMVGRGKIKSLSYI